MKGAVRKQVRIRKSGVLGLLHKAVMVATGWEKGGRNANHAFSVLVFSHRPTQNPRSELTGGINILDQICFLKANEWCFDCI